jgi:sporulation protein YlmC with PRC-barrel domain
MRLSAVIGAAVVDADGQRVATVRDVRLIQDGPLIGTLAAWRVSGLIVIEKRHMRLFGYERSVGPLLGRVAVRLLAGGAWFVPWRDVRELTSETVTVATRMSDWESLEDLPDRTVGTAER